MFGDDILAAQKSILANVYFKSRHDFLCCRKSYYKKPELVILADGTFYIDGLTICKKPFICAECHKSYLYKASLEMAKVEEYIQQEKLCPTMITLHIPHKISNGLKHLRIILDKAVRGFLAESKNKLMKMINKNVGNKGYILRNDITLTENGWNPHTHIINLQGTNFSEIQKNQLVDEFARQLESAGLYLNRLDRYNKSNLVHFRENSTSLDYLCKHNDTLMNLAITQPEKYVELARSCNIKEKIPLVKFKNGLKSKISKTLNLSENSTVREIKRIEIPEHTSLENIKGLSLGELKSYFPALV